MYMNSQEVLNCQHCHQKFDEPKLLPCGNTICNACIKAYLKPRKEKKKNSPSNAFRPKSKNSFESISNEYECLMCEYTHEYPANNIFPTNQHLLKLLNKEVKLFNLGESAEKLKSYAKSIQASRVELEGLRMDGKVFIEEYCQKLRKEAELSAERERHKLFKREEELCADFLLAFQ